ncbi:MAG TPA: HAMP domain-containing sensor histidine kinase [Phycisphaerales bacterium]|nr:HAMP domain-containing sensor histidine kinase [Phycisphaerales bacterium]
MVESQTDSHRSPSARPERREPDAGPDHTPAAPDLRVLDLHLERLNRLASMGAVTGMIAHEFNNILTPIMSYAQMALEEPENRELSVKALRRTMAGAERAAKIADAILNFVREDSGPIRPSHCKVAAVVAESAACLAGRTTDVGGRLTIRVPDGMEAAIEGARLQQVLVNLILNARAAMGDRERDMEIAATECPLPPNSPAGAADSRRCSSWNQAEHPTLRGPWIVITVRDRGPGMGAEQLDALFTPFRSGSDPAFHRGTGLGMTVSRRLIEAAGGWLVVESEQGRGTTVYIVLPARC